MFKVLLVTLLILQIRSEVCTVEQPGFVFLQNIGNGILTSPARGADISGDGKILSLLQLQTSGVKKIILYELNGVSFTSKGTNLYTVDQGTTNETAVNHQSFSTDGTKLVVTGTPIKLFNPKIVAEINSTNSFQSIQPTNEFVIFSELSQDGTLLTVSSQNSTFLNFKSYVYFLNGQTGQFIDPPFPLPNPIQKPNLNISPNKKYILAYTSLITPESDGTILPITGIVQIYVRNPSNQSEFQAPSTIGTFANMTVSHRGDITNDVVVIGSNTLLRIYTRTDGTDSFLETQNLDSLIAQRIVSVKLTNDNKYLFVGLRGLTNLTNGHMLIFSRNSANHYQLSQTLYKGINIQDVDASDNYYYLINANGAANIGKVNILCLKDYALNCSEPNKASLCLPTFAVIDGSCGCPSPLTLSKDGTNCSTSPTLGGTAGCCTVNQTWSRVLGACMSCPLTLNCQTCSAPNVCAVCKDGYASNIVNSVLVCSPVATGSIQVYLIVTIIVGTCFVLAFLGFAAWWHSSHYQRVSRKGERFESQKNINNNQSNQHMRTN